MTALVVNARARQGAAMAEAKQALQAAGLDVAVARQAGPGEVQPLVRELVQEHPLVVAGGGDGTISMAAGELAGTPAILGILPMGTQNSFARSLGIPLEMDQAANVIAGGRTQRVDLGQVGHRTFTHSVTIGVSTEVAQQTHATLKRIAGQAAYLLVGSKVLATHAPFRCRFLADGEARTHHTHQVVITSGGRLGPAELAPAARPDDHRLHVTTVGSGSRWAFVRGWAASVAGDGELPEGSERFEARDLMLCTDPPQRIDVDGEPGTLTPVRLRVLPGALRVRVP